MDHPECRHIKTSGGKCASRALIERPYCWYHTRLRERAARPASPYLVVELPATLEDRGAIQLALGAIVTALAEGRLETRRAGMLLYALQIASSNAKHQEEIVSTNSVSETVVNEHGEEMALEGATVLEPEEEEGNFVDLLLAEVKRRQQLDHEDESARVRQLSESTELDQ